MKCIKRWERRQMRKKQKSYTTNTKRVVTINLWKPRIWKYAYNYQVIHKHTIIILKCTPIHIYVHTYTYSIMHTWITSYIWIRYGYPWFCHHNLFCVQERQNKKHTHIHTWIKRIQNWERLRVYDVCFWQYLVRIPVGKSFTKNIAV